jgi:hypothetical protein
MRKAKREIKDKTMVEALLRRCHTVHLGLWDGKEPYVVTVDFGYEAGAIYFHSAPEGRKADCIRENGLVSFQAVAECELIRAEKGCGFTTHYKSVSGFGHGVFLTDPAEKAKGLDVIMQHHDGPTGGYEPNVLARTEVVRVALETLVGKVNPAFPGDPQI